MDVDSVFNGRAGKDQVPVDFNRTWADPRWNAVKEAINKLNSLKEENEIVGFVDVHDPWFRDKNYWLPSGEVEVFEEYFRQGLDVDGRANSWGRDFNRSKRRAERARPRERDYTRRRVRRTVTSTSFARANLLDEFNYVYMTAEVSHWKDNAGEFITIEGLHNYGRAFGRAFNKFLGGAVEVK